MIDFTTVIVTYANRGAFVKRVVYECISAGCNTFLSLIMVVLMIVKILFMISVYIMLMQIFI